MSKPASTKEDRKQFKLLDVRLSYPNLFTPRSMASDDGTEKKPDYSASFILDKKKHANLIKEIEAEAKKVATAKFGKVPAKFRGPVRDGSTFVDNETDQPKAGYGDAVVAINAKSQSRQHCVRRDMTPADEDDLYGGCYVNAVITLYPWKHPKSGCGVSANLGPVQFVRNGERFGQAVTTAEDAFEDLGASDDGDDDPTANM